MRNAALGTFDDAAVRHDTSATGGAGEVSQIYLALLPDDVPKEGHNAFVRHRHAGFCVPGRVAHYVAVSWGFAEVLPDRVIVLAQTSERAEEIDVERAQQSLQRAEERLKRLSDAEVDRERAQAALERAMARLEVAGKAAGRGTEDSRH